MGVNVPDEVVEPSIDAGAGFRLSAAYVYTWVDTTSPGRSIPELRDQGVVGHSQKLAAARDDGFKPKVTRRDFDSTDGGEAGMEFIGFMREIDAFVELQRAMHGVHLDHEPERNGIPGFFRAPSRATYLVPSRRLRAVPTPESV